MQSKTKVMMVYGAYAVLALALWQIGGPEVDQSYLQKLVKSDIKQIPCQSLLMWALGVVYTCVILWSTFAKRLVNPRYYVSGSAFSVLHLHITLGMLCIMCACACWSTRCPRPWALLLVVLDIGHTWTCKLVMRGYLGDAGIVGPMYATAMLLKSVFDLLIVVHPEDPIWVLNQNIVLLVFAYQRVFDVFINHVTGSYNQNVSVALAICGPSQAVGGCASAAILVFMMFVWRVQSTQTPRAQKKSDSLFLQDEEMVQRTGSLVRRLSVSSSEIVKEVGSRPFTFSSKLFSPNDFKPNEASNVDDTVLRKMVAVVMRLTADAETCQGQGSVAGLRDLLFRMGLSGDDVQDVLREAGLGEGGAFDMNKVQSNNLLRTLCNEIFVEFAMAAVSAPEAKGL